MQALRSILLHIDSSERSVLRTVVARQLSETLDAEVIAQPSMLTSLVRYPYAVEGAAAAVELLMSLDKEALDRAHASFVEAAAGSPRLHWAEPLADGPWGFARRALYADLLILGQRQEDDPADSEVPADFVPNVLAQSGRPALILPYAGRVDTVGRTVLVAWKETREAARAVSCALPLLSRAAQVHVVAHGEGVDEALRSLERYLGAHGVRATLHAGGAEEPDMGNALLSRAADLSADLLVMGAYGHSRAREWILGGATRTILQTMTLPVLMAH
jgi:nucleotide-binding universal stress UspA family protein